MAKKDVKVKCNLGNGCKSTKGGLTQKGRELFNKKTGSNLQRPVPNPKTPAERARKKSFCARSAGWNGERGKLAKKRWGCS